ncbi:DUF3027 domain-containing protein [Herbiconiux sp. UC225_62]|uniref:DUF3027 domain-containing protein n=1 Tax=Herbiconiux sp. UC225_62 TaxID=3350168 RepID=UPI0036D31F2B
MASDDSVDFVEDPSSDAPVDETVNASGEGQDDAAEALGEPAEKPAPVVDEVLLASVDLARAALLEITPAASIGDVVGSIADEDHVLSLHFESKLAGYPGWHWTVTVSRVDESSEPTVLEIEMLPGENALIAPDWVPWSERLAEYTLAQELAEATAADGESDDDDLDDDDSDDPDADEDDDHDLDDGLDLDDGIDIDDHVTDDDELEAAAEAEESAADDEPEGDDEPDDDESDDDLDDDPHAEGPWSSR